MREKEREIENAKKEVLVAKRNYLEKESEAEDFSKELNSIKGKLRIGSTGFNYDIRHTFSRYERIPTDPHPLPDLTLSSWKRLRHIPAKCQVLCKSSIDWLTLLSLWKCCILLILYLFIDKFAKCRKPDESLCSQVSELKKILVRREEINTKQKQLFRMLAADAQKKLDKASVDTRNLSEELKSLKGNFSIQQSTS